jgi:hypothetical protein
MTAQGMLINDTGNTHIDQPPPPDRRPGPAASGPHGTQ